MLRRVFLAALAWLALTAASHAQSVVGPTGSMTPATSLTSAYSYLAVPGSTSDQYYGFNTTTFCISSNNLNICTGGISGTQLASGAVVANLGYTPLNPANNLSDVGAVSTARTNLGLSANNCGAGEYASGISTSLGLTCSTPPGSGPGGSSGNLQTNNGSGGFGGLAIGSMFSTVGSTLNLATTGVAAATYGDSTHVMSCAINAQGQATSCSNVAISGGGSSTITNGTTATSGFTAGYLMIANVGNVVGSLPANLSSFPVTNTLHTTSGAVSAIGGLDVYNGSSLTATIPSAGTAGNGQTFTILNENATALTLSGGQTLNGIGGATTLSQGQWISCTGNGTSADCLSGNLGGGSGSVSVTAANAGIVINPTPGTGTFTVGSSFPVQAAKTSGSSYTVLVGDQYQTIVTNTSSAYTIDISQSTSGYFPPGTPVCFQDQGAGALTITPATSTIYGLPLTAGSLVIQQSGWACLEADSLNNYLAWGAPSPSVPATPSQPGVAKLYNAPMSAGWLSGANPDQGVIVADTAQALTITAINANATALAGGSATLDVYDIASGTATCQSGTKVNSSSFNANTAAGTPQSLFSGSYSLASGHSLCIHTPTWPGSPTSTATVSIYGAPS